MSGQTWIPEIIVGLGVPIGTMAAVMLQRSGRVRTSEATDLWLESRNIRTELREQVRELIHQVELLRGENLTLRARILELEQGRSY